MRPTGSSQCSNHWLLATAVLTHPGPVPATGLDLTAIAWLAGLSASTAIAGLSVFSHRDVAAARTTGSGACTEFHGASSRGLTQHAQDQSPTPT